MYLDNNFSTIHVPVRPVHTYSDTLRKLQAEFYHGLREFRKVERAILTCDPLLPLFCRKGTG